MDEFYRKFGSLSGHNVRVCASDSSRDESQHYRSSTISESASSKSSYKPPSGIISASLEETDEGDGNFKKPDPGKKLGTVSNSHRRYACPFYKHDPIKYAVNSLTGRKYRTCAGPGFESVSRVK
jgi:hypothetical protein